MLFYQRVITPTAHRSVSPTLPFAPVASVLHFLKFVLLHIPGLQIDLPLLGYLDHPIDMTQEPIEDGGTDSIYFWPRKKA